MKRWGRTWTKLKGALIGGSIALLVAVISAVVTICTNKVNNNENTTRLRLQLNHDSTQKRLEREITLKKEVFLGMVEAMSKLQDFLGHFADPTASQTEFNKLAREARAAMAKIYIVAQQNTLEAVEEINLCLSGSIQVLLVDKYEIDEMAKNTDGLQKELDSMVTQASVDQLREGQLRQELVIVRSELNRKQAALASKCVEHMNRFAQVSFKVIVLARQELGLPLDDGAVKALQTGMSLKLNKLERITQVINDVG
ncbi:MAG: hypothetical protein U0X75_15170 [Acidobacteriota bacterium]